MSLPINILSRSFRLIFAQPLETLKVIAPGVITTGLAALLAISGVVLWFAAREPSLLGRGAQALLILAGTILCLVGIAAFAVLWHRHALLQDEARAYVMRLSGRILGQYLLGVAIVSLITIVAAFPTGGVIGLAVAIMDHQGLETKTVEIVLTIALTVLLWWVALRISLILPAAAIGHQLDISQSWAATREISWDIFWTAVLLAVVNIVIFSIFGGLTTVLPRLETVFDIF